MPNAKISALSLATTPLAGTETLPVVQSSTTKQVSVANLTAGRTVAALAYTATGNSGFGTTSSSYSAQIQLTSATTNAPISPMGVVATTSGTAANGFGSQVEYLAQASDGSTYAQTLTTSVWTNATAANRSSKYSIWTRNNAGALTEQFTVGPTGDITANIGNLVQGTAAKGINFTANTPAAGMTSQLLNWYEEGTFTPSITGETTNPTVTYSTRQGYYTRVGRLVTIHIRMTLSAYSGGSGNALISGLPFTASGTGSPFPMFMELGGVTFGIGYTAVSYRPLTGTTYGRFNAVGSALGTAALAVSAISSSADIVVSGSYLV